METNLAKQLKKYFKKEGQRITFRNGLSLNQLAHEMGGLLYQQWGEWYYPSLLSKVINSQDNRFFSPIQLEAFCELVDLDYKERWDIEYALYQDHFLRSGVEVDPFISKYPLEPSMELLETVHNSSRQGDSSTANVILPWAINQLLSMRTHHNRAKDLAEIDRLLAKALVDLMFTYSLTKTKGQIIQATSAYMELLNSVQYALKRHPEDVEDYDLVKVVGQMIQYVAYNLEECNIKLREYSSELSTSLPTSECVRISIVSNSLITEKGIIPKKEGIKQFKDDIENSISIMEKGFVTAGDCAQIYEGISRACGLLGIAEAQKWLDIAKLKNKVAQENGTSIANVQATIMRTGLLNLVNDPEVDPQIIIGKVVEAEMFFSRTGYVRLENHIIKKLKRHSNKFLREFAAHIHNKG